MNDQLLKPAQVAKDLNCSEALVYKMMTDGRLPYVGIPMAGERKRMIRRVLQKDLRTFKKRHYCSLNQK